MMSELLDREDFRLWLAAMDPDDEVWSYPPSYGCPISRYLKDRTGLQWVTDSMGMSACLGEDRVLGGGQAWTYPFVQVADDVAQAEDRARPTLAAKEALSILDNLDLSTQGIQQ